MKQVERSSRPDRVAAQIQRELGEILLLHVKDPRLNQVNITAVRVTRDLSLARVYYLLLGIDGLDAAALKRLKREVASGLGSASSFIRREIGQRLRLRLTPRLEFYWDDTVEHGRRMEDVFAELAAERAAHPIEPGDPEGDAPPLADDLADAPPDDDDDDDEEAGEEEQR